MDVVNQNSDIAKSISMHERLLKAVVKRSCTRKQCGSGRLASPMLIFLRGSCILRSCTKSYEKLHIKPLMRYPRSVPYVRARGVGVHVPDFGA